MASTMTDQAEPIRGWKARPLARAIHVAPQVVYAAISSGELSPVWRFGRAIVIPQASVDSWLASKSTGTPDAA